MPETPAREFLGMGWKFPLQVSASGGIARARYEQRIEESIYLILSTAKGERVMLPKFGCGIHEQVFAPNDSTTLSRLTAEVRDALLEFEPRVDVVDVNAEAAAGQPNLVLIRIGYRIRANQTMGNLVYPFYITERT